MRKNRKLVGQRVIETLNTSTGEHSISEIKGIYKSYALEHFTMVRFTDDDKWIKELKPVLPLLLIMSQWIDSASDIVPLSSDRREYLCRFFDLSNPRSLTTLLAQAIILDGMTRVNGSTSAFMINPAFIYRGSTKGLAGKIMKYVEYKGLGKMGANTNFENE
jgi:hypothetical protein